MRELLVFLLLVFVGICAAQNPRYSLWPHPQSVTNSSNLITLIPLYKSFQIQIQTPLPETDKYILQSAIDRYKSLIFYDDSVQESADLCDDSKFSCISTLQIVITGKNFVKIGDSPLNLETDESYQLAVPSAPRSKDAQIQSKSVFGAIRALETFSQMVQVHPQTGLYTICYTIASQADNRNLEQCDARATPVVVKDAPRFPWRGLLVDTSRHYLSVNMIKKILDAMSYIKLNVMHWHVVDAQSFPLVVPDHPNLSQYGAYAPKAIYTPAQVQDIVKYALFRGIRVMFEIDVPGHTGSWRKAYPDIVAKCPNYVQKTDENTFALNPSAEPLVNDVVDSVISYASQASFDEYIHLGGDELDVNCWKEDPSVQAFMQKKGFSKYDELLAYFEQNVYKSVQKNNKTMVAWQELLLNYDQSIMQVPKNIIMQAWINPSDLQKLVTRGFKSLLSAGWYLDRQFPIEASHYEWVDTWKDFYGIEPYATGNYTEEQKKLILGGEAAMWAEQVDDTNFESRVFPRVLAVAERLWSPAEINVLDLLTTMRLEHHRCTMVRRGIRGGPVLPGYCKWSY